IVDNNRTLFKLIRKKKLFFLNADAESFKCCCVTSGAKWHQRLGHPGESKMNTLSKLFPEVINDKNGNCDVCLTTKFKRLPYPPSESRAKAPLELLHIDVCGP